MWQERGAPWVGACIIRPPLLRPCGEREARLRSYWAFAAARLRHYAEASGRLLLRQWQGMLLLGLVVIGQATTIFMLPASGLASLARRLDPVGLFALVLLAVLFVLPQRRALRGGGLEGFGRTLPIPMPLRLLVDATVLLLADGLLLLELGLAAAIGGPAALAGLAGILALVLAAQLVALHLPLPDPRRTVRRLPLPPMLRANLQALAEYPASSGSRILVALLVVAGTAAIATAFHFDPRALPVAIAGLALAAFILADFYRLLRDTHAPIRAFLATLPLSPHHLALRDLLTALTLGAVPYLMLAAWFGVFDPGSLVAFALLAVAYAGLLAALRLPVLRGGHLGAMLAALLAAAWAGSAIAMVLK
jgi:hypothetical protein